MQSCNDKVLRSVVSIIDKYGKVNQAHAHLHVRLPFACVSSCVLLANQGDIPIKGLADLISNH